MNAPIGILGGTFDPIHFGHLRLAQEVAEQLDLAEVRFVPSATPPHRAAPQTPATDRAAMVRLAIAGNPLFALDERELHRMGPSYTFDTLKEIRGELGAQQSVVLLLGADAFAGFATWRRWTEVFGLAHIVIAHRPGVNIGSWQSTLPVELLREFMARKSDDTTSMRRAPTGGIVVLPIPALDISATAVREALRAKRSPRYLLPDAVIEYIHDNYLFL